LGDTDAGQTLQGGLIAEWKKFQQRGLELREDMELDMQEKDEKLQREPKRSCHKKSRFLRNAYCAEHMGFANCP
jgi:hypothetical protein